MYHPPPPHPVAPPPCLAWGRVGIVVVALDLLPWVPAAAAVDASKLPPAATAPVEFARDIQPVLERSCLRCHGPEKPKSNFRLDSREAALKGGSIGVAIVLSNSAASPLIHYVARLPEVGEDLWMPPEGKTPALSPEEVALFRAWIDQGLPWGTSTPPVTLAFEVAPALSWTTAHGHERVFREHHWRPEGWNGGVESFELREPVDPRTRLYAEGRALRDDYRLTLALERVELGFVRAGFEQFRKYYSDSGGYAREFAPPIYALDRDLHLDLGRSWVDVGLTLPAWPRLTLGYEHQYKEGEKSLTSWSPITQNGSTLNLFPTSKQVDEETHLLKFNLDYERRGLRVEDDFRAEWSQLRTTRTNGLVGLASPDRLSVDRVQEGQNSFQAANALRLERQVTSWFLGSGGYLYSHFDAEASFSLDEAYLSGPPGLARRWHSPAIVLERNAHVGNLNGQLGPWAGLVASLGVQTEWSRQHAWGQASFDYEQPGGGFFLQPTPQESVVDRAIVTEHLGLRYSRIPRTVFFAEGRLQQESLDQAEDQPAGDYPLRRATDTRAEVLDFRGGFHTSPWQRTAFSASYRWIDKQARYDHWVDVVPTPLGDFPGDGYSAFIRRRDTRTEEVEARLAYHWSAWLKTTFSYRLVASDYETTTDAVTGYDPITFQPIPGYISPGTRLLAGNYDASIYSVHVVLRPASRLTLNGTFSFHEARTVTAANQSPAVAPYRGHLYRVTAGGSYAWNAKTDLLAQYAFTHADYDQDPPPDSLPLGVVYDQHGLMVGLRRRLAERLHATVRYGFYFYDEPTSGGFNDYTAHTIFATLQVRLP